MRDTVAIGRPLKPLLMRTWLRQGAVRRILLGPAKGLRYRIFGPFRAPVFGGWEPEAQRLMVKHLAPGGVAYDIGANIGVHTLLMARLVGPRGRVHAFEPVPHLFERLKENIALNPSLGCAEAWRLALSDASGTAAFYTGHHTGAGHLETAGVASGQRLVVNTISLDAFVGEGGREPPTFIKIDVEGAEGKVLAGAERVLRVSRPTLLVDLHTPEQDEVVGSLLRKARYSAFRTHDGSHVCHLERGWPDPDGLWGKFIAFPTDAGHVT